MYYLILKNIKYLLEKYFINLKKFFIFIILITIIKFFFQKIN